MPIAPVAPPQAVPIYSGFDYVTVDAVHRRVYAAHTGSNALLVVDADSGKVVTQVRVGPLHGVAVDPASGHVYVGAGTDKSVAEIDPLAAPGKELVRSVDVDGNVDAIAYDSATGKIFADEDDGTRAFVIDAKTFKPLGVVALPGHKPEYLAIDPVTHDVYQNIANLSEFVVVDGATMKVKKTVATPDIVSNHPLQFDGPYQHVLVGGSNGILESFDTTGKMLGKLAVQPRIDQCDLDATSHVLACAGNGQLTVIAEGADGALSLTGQTPIPKGAHTVGIDAKTGNAWIVYATPAGDFVQGFTTSK